MKPIETEADMDRMLRGAKALAVLSAWNEAGLFSALQEGPKPLRELSGAPRALRASAAVLRHLGVLVGDDETVALSPVARRLLEQGGMPTARNFGALSDLARMPDILRDGEPLVASEGGVTDDPEANRRFMDMLYRRSAESVSDTLQWTRALLPAQGHVLDLGGGHGRYAATYAEAGHRATLLDKPEVVPFARERYGEQIEYLEGDFMQLESLGGPYDLVLLSNIIHGLSPADNTALLRRLAACTKPGGHVVLKDFFLDPTGRFDERAAFFGMTMLFYTRGGAVYSHREVSAWLAETGFEPPHTVALDSFELIVSRRGLG